MKKEPVAAGKSSFGLIDFRKLLAELRVENCRLLVDLACGAGAYSVEIAKHLSAGARVHAVDLWAQGIEQLNERVRRAGLERIDTEVADISQRVGLADESADICLMATVLHDLIEEGTDGGAISEVKRLLRRGGRLAVVEFKKIDGPPGPPVRVRLSPEELATYMNPHGFVLRNCVDIGACNYLAILDVPRV